MRGLTLADPALVGTAGASFNPFASSYPTPTHAVWAGDPLWSNPGEGNAVSSMRNVSGGGNPAQATGAAQPIYRATSGGMNNRPTVQFDGTDDVLDVDITDIAQPFQVLAAVRLTTAGATVRRFLGQTSTGRGIGQVPSAWNINYAGVTFSGPATDTNPHVIRCTVNGASSVLAVDGSATAGTVASDPQRRFSIGADFTLSFWLGHIAFVGIYAAGASLTALETAMRVHYGTV